MFYMNLNVWGICPVYLQRIPFVFIFSEVNLDLFFLLFFCVMAGRPIVPIPDKLFHFFVVINLFSLFSIFFDKVFGSPCFFSFRCWRSPISIFKYGLIIYHLIFMFYFSYVKFQFFFRRQLYIFCLFTYHTANVNFSLGANIFFFMTVIFYFLKLVIFLRRPPEASTLTAHSMQPRPKYLAPPVQSPSAPRIYGCI